MNIGTKRKNDEEKLNKNENITTINDQSSEKKARLPKRKVAVLFGYNGKGYQGSQINPKMKTIEGQLINAFFRAGCISKENVSDPSKVGLQRAARTDASVHACCNLISLKLILNPISLTNSKYEYHTFDQDKPSIDQKFQELHSDILKKHSPFHSLVQHINQFLPSEIRIWNLVRVQNSFNARSYCDSRVYQYSFPTLCFLPPKPGTYLHTRFSNQIQTVDHPKLDQPPESNWWAEHPELFSNPSFKSIQFEAKKSYRISQPMIHKIKSVLDQFKGTHNFHNFTIGQNFNQPNSIRIMKNLQVSEPFLIPLDPISHHSSSNSDQSHPLFTEWISITFHGQSFMLHQIRKMVALVILLCRTETPVKDMQKLYSPVKVRIPKAPGIGLILKELNFNGYNQQVSKANEKNQRTNGKNNPLHRPVSEQRQDDETNQAEEDNLPVCEPIELDRFRDLFEMFQSEVLIKQMYTHAKPNPNDQKDEQGAEGENIGINNHDEDVSQFDKESRKEVKKGEEKENGKNVDQPKPLDKVETVITMEVAKNYGMKTQDEVGGREGRKANIEEARNHDLKTQHDSEMDDKEVSFEERHHYDLKTPRDGVKENEETELKVEEGQTFDLGTNAEEGLSEEKKEVKVETTNLKEGMVETRDLKEEKVETMNCEAPSDLKPDHREGEEEQALDLAEPSRLSDQAESNYPIGHVSAEILDSPPHPTLGPSPGGDTHQDLFDVWINYMDVSTGSDLNFLNPNGILHEPS